MIITIKKAVLHIHDGNSAYYSSQELNTDDSIKYITNCINKAYNAAILKKGVFLYNSVCKTIITEYLNKTRNFLEMTIGVCERMFEALSETDKPKPTDVIVCECACETGDFQ